MKSNIDRKGRLIRALMAGGILGSSIVAYFAGWPVWICLILLLAGLFVAFEAARGWCAARACGIKTKF